MRLPSYISFALILYNSYSIAQINEEPLPVFAKIYNYKLVIEAPLYECNILGNQTENIEVQVAEPGAIFTIVGKTDSDKLIVRFWKWKENTALNNILCFTDSTGVKRKYFLLAKADLYNKAIPRYDIKPCFTAGTILIPVKLRLQNFDFSKDLTLGPAAGMNIRLSHYKPNFVSVLGGVGITSVTIDGKTSDSITEDPIDVPALTPSIGFVFEFSNSSQAGIFLGWDFIADNETIKMVYYGKPWIAFGLGFSILTKGNYDSEIDEGNQ